MKINFIWEEVGLSARVLDWVACWRCTGGSRVRIELEKSLNLILVLENSWNLKRVSFVLELCEINLESMN